MNETDIIKSTSSRNNILIAADIQVLLFPRGRYHPVFYWYHPVGVILNIRIREHSGRCIFLPSQRKHSRIYTLFAVTTVPPCSRPSR